MKFTFFHNKSAGKCVNEETGSNRKSRRFSFEVLIQCATADRKKVVIQPSGSFGYDVGLMFAGWPRIRTDSNATQSKIERKLRGNFFCFPPTRK